jgi:hypothetical protein
MASSRTDIPVEKYPLACQVIELLQDEGWVRDGMVEAYKTSNALGSTGWMNTPTTKPNGRIKFVKSGARAFVATKMIYFCTGLGRVNHVNYADGLDEVVTVANNIWLETERTKALWDKS